MSKNYILLTTAKNSEDDKEIFAIYHDLSEPDKILLMPFNQLLHNKVYEDLTCEKINLKTNRKIKINNVYVHFRNRNKYLALHKAIHVNTGIEYVIYMALYGENDTWARTAEMFLEQVDFKEEKFLRFKEIEKLSYKIIN
jgi:hypothetical protein